MVAVSSETFAQLFQARATEYKNLAPASILFWDHSTSNRNERGLRVECPTLHREFVHTVSVGKDPEGTLFFDDVDELGDIDGTLYNVFFNTARGVDRTIVVQFLTPKGTPYAEFVGKDPHNNVTTLVTQQSGGAWRELEQGTSAGHVAKTARETTVTMTFAAINKTVTFDVPDNKSRGAIKKIPGTLTFRNISQIASGTTSVVDYSKDRIVFYKDASATDFVAMFVPLIITQADTNNLGDFEFNRTVTAKWT